MAAVGFVWFLAALIPRTCRYLFAIDGLLNALPSRSCCMLVAFPTAALNTRRTVPRRARVLRRDSNAVDLGAAPGHGRPRCLCRLPSNPLLISDQEVVSGVASGLQTLIAVAGVSGVAVLLYRRWRSASRLPEHALPRSSSPERLPAFCSSIGLMVNIFRVPNRSADVMTFSAAAATASVPLAFLAGLMGSPAVPRSRGRLKLVQPLGEPDRRQGLHDALADALGDPTLSPPGLWVPDQVDTSDASGRPRWSCPARKKETEHAPMSSTREPRGGHLPRRLA